MAANVFAFEKQLKNQTKKDILASKLLEMIFSGLLRDGDTLPSERELCAMFGVSRETVRGAIGMIAAYGLISVSHGAKSRVNRNDELLKRCIELLPQLSNLTINNYDIEAVFQSRKVVEAAIAHGVAIHIDQQGLSELKALLEQQESLFEKPAHFQISDQRFHKLISDYSDNAILAGYADELYAYGLNFRRSVLEQEGAIQKSFIEHYEIYKALEQGNPKLAEKAMLDHLNSVYYTTISAMRN
ncbi:FadR/GntR family transcriptional regulator [Vibrio penaeicida]|uniref:GntR family transcriptional regulator n=1 Tax=Vibrio penaeicida TaxID=104609 RepID=A0AAV5NXA5_9VIBR|nr:FCD domain-containing protein [Vibrio penaeicida]RTZ22258.1 FadR family transcriptional regulator [Vibrio penaeicida]GLQ74939.1 GntR family transcriptional regulator [Vibrio penaeicida]